MLITKLSSKIFDIILVKIWMAISSKSKRTLKKNARRREIYSKVLAHRQRPVYENTVKNNPELADFMKIEERLKHIFQTKHKLALDENWEAHLRLKKDSGFDFRKALLEEDEQNPSLS